MNGDRMFQVQWKQLCKHCVLYVIKIVFQPRKNDKMTSSSGDTAVTYKSKLNDDDLLSCACI